MNLGKKVVCMNCGWKGYKLQLSPAEIYDLITGEVVEEWTGCPACYARNVKEWTIELDEATQHLRDKRDK